MIRMPFYKSYNNLLLLYIYVIVHLRMVNIFCADDKSTIYKLHTIG